MNGPDLASFLGGGITFGFAIAGLFFVRFWRRTRDSLFLAFGISFLLLSINQALLSLAGVDLEERSPLFLIRLAAYLLIIAAIVCKNARSTDQ